MHNSSRKQRICCTHTHGRAHTHTRARAHTHRHAHTAFTVVNFYAHEYDCCVIVRDECDVKLGLAGQLWEKKHGGRKKRRKINESR